MRRLMAGGILVGGGLLLHLVEPVARLECARASPGPAQCTVTRSWFGVLPYVRERVSAAALAAEPRRSSRVDPEKVTCTALSLIDGAGDATEFACLEDAAMVARAGGFFAEGAAERSLDLRHAELLLIAASAVLILAGLAVAASELRAGPRAVPPPARGSRSRP